VVSSGISTPFGELFRTSGQITHVLLTRAPLYSPLRAFSLDLHVLGTPPAFVLSQDQTLQLRVFSCLPPLSRRAGMCFGMICKLKERGTAFLRRLAIQFSKTELHPSIRESALEPSLDRRGVARTTVLRQGGRLLPLRPEYRQEESSKPSSRTTSRHEGVDIYINPLRPSSHPGDTFSSPFRPRGAASTPLTGTPSSKRQVSLQLPPGVPIGEGGSFIRGALPCQASPRNGVAACPASGVFPLRPDPARLP